MYTGELDVWLKGLSSGEKLLVFEKLSEYLSVRELNSVMSGVSRGADLYSIHRKMGLLDKYYVDLLRIKRLTGL